MVKKTPEHTPAEAQRQVDLINASLLLVGEKGKARPIDQQAAAKLLGQITLVEAGFKTVNHLIPVSALQKAGSITEYWDQAVQRGVLEKVTYKKKACYLLVPEFAIDDYLLSNSFIQRLELLAGVSHEQARGTADKYTAPARPDKGRLH